MLTAALWVTLGAIPGAETAFLADDTPRHIRLVDDEEQSPYAGWTRARLHTEYDRVEASRPGIGLEVSMIVIGGSGAAIGGIWLASALTSFFGAPVLVAIALAITIVVCLGLAVFGTIRIVGVLPERRAATRQLEQIEEAYRATYFNKPQPCPQGPEGPPPNVPKPPEYQPSPSVMVPTNSITLAVF